MVDITLTSDVTVKAIDSLDYAGGDWRVVAAARVLDPERAAKYREEVAWHGLPEKDKRMVRRMVRHRHGSVFEHASLTFYVRAPIFVWREWHRHRIGTSYNEESSRYKPLEPVFWVPRRNRPMVPVAQYKAIEPQFVRLEDDSLWADVQENSAVSYSAAYARYQSELNRGIAREVARRLLPVAIYSSGWFTCNPRSLMHFLSLRVRDERNEYETYPQLEIQEAALQLEAVFAEGWPVTYEAFNDYGRVGP